MFLGIWQKVIINGLIQCSRLRYCCRRVRELVTGRPNYFSGSLYSALSFPPEFYLPSPFVRLSGDGDL
jgi:hypothetical protein